MANNIFRREPIQYKTPTDDSRLFHINNFKGIQVSDNPLIADKDSCYYCKNVFRNEVGNLTVRPRLEVTDLEITEPLEIRNYWRVGDITFWYAVSDAVGKLVSSTGIVLDNISIFGCTMQLYQGDDSVITPYFLFSNTTNSLLFYKFSIGTGEFIGPVTGVEPPTEGLRPVDIYNVLSNQTTTQENKSLTLLSNDNVDTIMRFGTVTTDAPMNSTDTLFERANLRTNTISDATDFIWPTNNVGFSAELSNGILYVTVVYIDSSGEVFVTTHTGAVDVYLPKQSDLKNRLLSYGVVTDPSLGLVLRFVLFYKREYNSIDRIAPIRFNEIIIPMGAINDRMTVTDRTISVTLTDAYLSTSQAHIYVCFDARYIWIRYHSNMVPYPDGPSGVVEQIIDVTTGNRLYFSGSISSPISATTTYTGIVGSIKTKVAASDQESSVIYYDDTPHRITFNIPIVSSRVIIEGYTCTIVYGNASGGHNQLWVVTKNGRQLVAQTIGYSGLDGQIYSANLVASTISIRSTQLVDTPAKMDVYQINIDGTNRYGWDISSSDAYGDYYNYEMGMVMRVDGSRITTRSYTLGWSYIQTDRNTDIIPTINALESGSLKSNVVTSLFLDGFYWFITEDYIFGTGAIYDISEGTATNTIEFWDFGKYFKLQKKAIAAARVSDTSFWVFHDSGAFLIYKTEQTDVRGRFIWAITETAETKSCYFKNAVVTLPVTSNIATITSEDISQVVMRRNVQTDDRIMQPITFRIAELIRDLIGQARNVIIANYRYLTLFAFNLDNTNRVIVLDNQSNDFWLWEIPGGEIYQMKTTERNIEILLRTDENTYKIFNLSEDEFDYQTPSKTFSIYADLYPDNVSPRLIDWYWESAVQSFGTIDLRKQLLRTTFTFTDFGDEVDTGVEYGFNIYRKYTFTKTSDVDSTTAVQTVRNKVNRTYITTFNFLQLHLQNLKLDDYMELGERLEYMVKPKLASVSFVFRLIQGIGSI